MNLVHSHNLKELPDFSNATNLEKLNLDCCDRLVEIPSSFGNLQKLKELNMGYCVKLQTVPTHINLASLETVNMLGCLLREIPDISRNITSFAIAHPMIEDLPRSVRLWSRLENLCIGYGPDIEKIPDCIKDLHGLQELHILGFPKLASLPELPSSLRKLKVEDCESLETLMPFPSESSIEALRFINCLKLGEEARRVITQQSSHQAWLPGRNVPEEFDRRAIGNSLIIPSGTKECRTCIVISPKQQMKEEATLFFHLSCNGQLFSLSPLIPKIRKEHLFIRHTKIGGANLGSYVFMEFSTSSKDIDIIECGIQSFTNRRHRWKERSLWHHDMSCWNNNRFYRRI